MTGHEIVFTIIALIVGFIIGWKAGLDEGRKKLWNDLYQRWVEWKSRK